jgi:hypothetical protein
MIDWLDAADRTQFEWAIQYLNKKHVNGWISPENITNRVAAQNPKLIKDMRQAWKQKVTRRNRKSSGIEAFRVELSKSAHSKLKHLAKLNKANKDETLEELILNAANFERRVREQLAAKFDEKVIAAVRIKQAKDRYLLKAMITKDSYLQEFIPTAELMVKDLSSFLKHFRNT